MSVHTFAALLAKCAWKRGRVGWFKWSLIPPGASLCVSTALNFYRAGWHGGERNRDWKRERENTKQQQLGGPLCFTLNERETNSKKIKEKNPFKSIEKAYSPTAHIEKREDERRNETPSLPPLLPPPSPRPNARFTVCGSRGAKLPPAGPLWITLSLSLPTSLSLSLFWSWFVYLLPSFFLLFFFLSFSHFSFWEREGEGKRRRMRERERVGSNRLWTHLDNMGVLLCTIFSSF